MSRRRRVARRQSRTFAAGVRIEQVAHDLIHVTRPGDGPVPIRLTAPHSDPAAEWAPGRSRSLPWFEAISRVMSTPTPWRVTATAPRGEFADRAFHAGHWCMRGWTADQAAAWEDAGVPGPQQAHRWTRQNCTPADAQRWLAVTTESAVPRWLRLTATPQDAATHQTPERLDFARAAGLPTDTGDWSALWQAASREFVAAGYRQGNTPDSVARLASALADTGPEATSGLPAPFPRLAWGRDTAWRRSTNAQEWLAFAETLHGLNWGDVGLCLRFGMTQQEARAHVAAGEDLTSMRVLVALM